MSEDTPQGFWIFSVRVSTTKVRTPTKRMQEKIAKKISKIAGVCEVQVEEDFSKDPLKPFEPMFLADKPTKKVMKAVKLLTQ